MSEVAYRVTDVTCRRRGRTVVDGVSLDVRAGKVLALVGPNGAGKSTLLAVLSGDLDPSGGTVELAGRPLGDWSPKERSRRRAVLLQSNTVSFPFTVREVVEMGRSPWWGLSSAEDDERIIAEALRRADVDRFADRPFSMLSGGERARVSLARVLAQDTPVVLLDEPTAALDLGHQEDVMAIARDLARHGRAVVVVVHDLSLAGAWADEIAMLEDGRLVAHGTPTEVLTAEQVERTYGVAVDILVSPSNGTPLVVPRRGTDADRLSERRDDMSQ